MCDKLVFDLAQEVEGQPSVFIRKDWINCLDNQNQNYNGNQSILDTSQLSNSNKYMSYREAYLSIPFVLTVVNQPTVLPAGPAGGAGLVSATITNVFSPSNALDNVDYAIGLKSWFGQIIHSFTLDYNGTTIIQQTPYINMWNSFRLMTSLSLDDVNTQGATIGFFPDDSLSWGYQGPNAVPATAQNNVGNGTVNNTNAIIQPQLTQNFNVNNSKLGNSGFLKRQRLICFDPAGNLGTTANPVTYDNLINNGVAGAFTQLWKSYIYNKTNQASATVPGVLQIAVVATVYLKHIHGFFNMIPLLKGVFMKMTMNLNNTSTTIGVAATYPDTTFANAPALTSGTYMNCISVSNPLGGVNPLNVASASTVYTGAAFPFDANAGTFNTVAIGTLVPPTVADNAATTSTISQAGNQYALRNGGFGLLIGGTTPDSSNTNIPAGQISQRYLMNISVGSTCLDTQINSAGGALITPAPLSKSIYLYIPAYTFNPPFEQAYLSNPVKTIKYTDLYQYQVTGVGAGANFNNLITNGIANIKSVLVLPFYNSGGTAQPCGAGDIVTNLSPNSGFVSGVPVWQSPFDGAGTGTTSPLCYLTNFNIQISGQNAIYNTQRYLFEEFNNQLYGQNAVNGGLTDGLTSGLIDRQAFDNNYCYYYVNVERMLPAEQQVPKSVQLIGTNLSAKILDLYVFVEFGVEVKIDCLTGARV